MNSSTGFKKRSLLRPPSGMLSHQRQYLKSIDISQSEAILASNIRTEVASIQEQINLLDNDKKIRSGQSSLQKGYALSMKKWLSSVQSMIEKEDEDGKILKYMGVDSYESGFRKLWKVLTNLDLITTKVTELQIISFLKYDQMFGDMAEDSASAQKILEKIAKGGFNPSNFHPSQLLIDRYHELFSVVSDIRRQGSIQNSSKGFSKQTKDQTNELIEQLRRQNSKLVNLLEQLEQNSQKQEQKLKQSTISHNNSVPSSPDSMFNQLENKYKEQLKELQNKIQSLNRQISQLKIHSNNLQVRYKATEQELKDLKNNDLGKQKVSPGSYEEALLEEMTKMKAGFEKKIQRIIDQYNTKQREMRKKQYEYKAQNDRIKWQKGLLMKKFDALSAQ